MSDFLFSIFYMYLNIFSYLDLPIFYVGDDAGTLDFNINLYEYGTSSVALYSRGDIGFYLAMLCTIITLILLLYMIYKICKLIICRIANV